MSAVGQQPSNNIEVDQLRRSGMNTASQNVIATSLSSIKLKRKKKRLEFLSANFVLKE